MNQDFSEVFKNKKDSKKNFFKKYQIPKTSRAIIVNNLKNENLKKTVTDACRSVDIFVFESLDGVDFLAIDAIIADNIEKKFFKNISQNLVIPIILNQKDSNFSEFNPMKFEGNSFLFDKMELFSIFEKVSRMLENSQYAGDKRMLLKNIFLLGENI